MENPKDQTVEALKSANNVLVTVSSNPSVDQLSAAIGLTLLLNKMGKHASAVFSGEVPSTIEFLKPEETLEKNTDSLRDFIIALDKSKADKLRYKVEDKHVKIFITPYRTSISQDDLEFSQGDFNVDAVIALGVQKREELDQAITAHGRILHDAKVVTINTTQAGELGTTNWTQSDASSLCELVAAVAEDLKAEVDAQVATALLTGIVAETERFSNEKTSAAAMTSSAKLMAQGANQQLVATQLQELPKKTPKKKGNVANFDDKKMDELAHEIPNDDQTSNQNNPPTDGSNSATDGELPAPVESGDGSMQVDHGKPEGDEANAKGTGEASEDSSKSFDQLMDDLEDDQERIEQIDIDEHGTLLRPGEGSPEDPSSNRDTSPSPVEPTNDHLNSPDSTVDQAPEAPESQIAGAGDEPPSIIKDVPTMMGNVAPASSAPAAAEPPSVDMLAAEPPKANDQSDQLRGGMKTINPLSDSGLSMTPTTAPADLPPGVSDEPVEPAFEPPQTLTHAGPQTLSDLENAVHSSHVDAQAVASEQPHPLDSARDAVQSAIGAVPDPNPDPIAALNAQHADLADGASGNIVANPTGLPTMPANPDLPANLVPPGVPEEQTASPVDQATPPPVPPPIIPPSPPTPGGGSSGNPLLPQ